MLKRGGLIAIAVAVLAAVSIGIGSQVVKSAASPQPSPSQVVAAGTATPAATAVPAGVTRTYYIAADTVHWNFAPQGMNLITGQPFGDRENTYLKAGPDRIGAVNLMSQ
jgi:manganese oxidase